MAQAEKELFERYGRTIPNGEVLFHLGDFGNEMYVIQKGKIEISVQVGGHQKVLAILEAGEFFGEMALLNGRPRSATARILADTDLLVIDHDTFQSMIIGNPEISLQIIKKLAMRLQEADRQIEALLANNGAETRSD